MLPLINSHETPHYFEGFLPFVLKNPYIDLMKYSFGFHFSWVKGTHLLFVVVKYLFCVYYIRDYFHLGIVKSSFLINSALTVSCRVGWRNRPVVCLMGQPTFLYAWIQAIQQFFAQWTPCHCQQKNSSLGSRVGHLQRAHYRPSSQKRCLV